MAHVGAPTSLGWAKACSVMMLAQNESSPSASSSSGWSPSSPGRTVRW
ncbi:putative lipoprotein [Mycobacterium kansasii]|uniref:Putative lipoprotein n=1 Tax=Mycobacterium kansasii TaxID=1768 RepID=A0A1V3XT39_MYCKA|nr:putative lipoprotein [Mycobacterium kansasii]